jgi:hypothetical protein
MPVSLEFLRGLLGGLSIFFAHFFGRTVVKVSKGRARRRALYTWALRFILTIAAICYRSVDQLAIIVLTLCAVAFGAGWWDEWRPKHEEDLTHTMFPDDQ